jgi:hypothetical protein
VAKARARGSRRCGTRGAPSGSARAPVDVFQLEALTHCGLVRPVVVVLGEGRMKRRASGQVTCLVVDTMGIAASPLLCLVQGSLLDPRPKLRQSRSRVSAGPGS